MVCKTLSKVQNFWVTGTRKNLESFLKGDELCLPCCVPQKELLNQLVLF